MADPPPKGYTLQNKKRVRIIDDSGMEDRYREQFQKQREEQRKKPLLQRLRDLLKG